MFFQLKLKLLPYCFAKCFHNIFFLILGGTVGTEERIKTDPQRIILVMFLGGCTYSEISALRFIGREKGEDVSDQKF